MFYIRLYPWGLPIDFYWFPASNPITSKRCYIYSLMRRYVALRLITSHVIAHFAPALLTSWAKEDVPNKHQSFCNSLQQNILLCVICDTIQESAGFVGYCNVFVVSTCLLVKSQWLICIITFASSLTWLKHKDHISLCEYGLLQNSLHSWALSRHDILCTQYILLDSCIMHKRLLHQC